MAVAAILKIGLMAISRPLWHIFARNFIQGLKTQAILPSKFNSRKIQDGGGRHFEIHFNGHNSVTITHVFSLCAKFCANNVPETELTSYFTSDKIQDGGGRHFENWFNGNIALAMAYICMKFYTGTKNHTPQAILVSKLNSCKIQDGGGSHFEIRPYAELESRSYDRD